MSSIDTVRTITNLVPCKIYLGSINNRIIFFGFAADLLKLDSIKKILLIYTSKDLQGTAV